MVYLDYALFQQKYFDTQKKYDEILNEQEELFTRTQPKAVQFKEPSGGSSCNVNALDNYLIEKDRRQIDKRLAEIKSLMSARKELLQIKERELRSSCDCHDKIFRMKYIDHRTIRQIARNTGYSDSQVYRILAIINEKISETIGKV